MKLYLKFTSTLLCCAILLAGCGNKNTDNPQAGGPGGGMPNGMASEQTQTAVEITSITKSLIQNKYMYSGTVAPANEVSVLSTLSGKVSTVNFDVGDQVSAGDILFQMDTSDIENNIAVTKASLTSAEANIKTAETNLEYANGSSMQSQIASATSTLSNAQITYDNAKSNYDKYKSLYDQNVISEAEWTQYKTAFSQAEVSLTLAKENYKITTEQTPKENLEKAQNALTSAKASKESILAQLNSSQKSLNDSKVVAPISGVISECNVTANTVLSQGASAPFVIVDLSSVNIEVNISAELINHISVGNNVDVKVSTVSSDYIPGTIFSISPVANSDGTYKVKVSVPNSNSQLKSGMFGEVYFVREKTEDAIVLPREAVLSKDDTYYVYIEQDGKAVKTTVEVGIDNGDEIEITSGLSEGMNVITKGQSYLADGDLVKVTNSEASSTTDSTESTTTDLPTSSKQSQTSQEVNMAQDVSTLPEGAPSNASPREE